MARAAPTTRTSRNLIGLVTSEAHTHPRWGKTPVARQGRPLLSLNTLSHRGRASAAKPLLVVSLPACPGPSGTAPIQGPLPSGMEAQPHPCTAWIRRRAAVPSLKPARVAGVTASLERKATSFKEVRDRPEQNPVRWERRGSCHAGATGAAREGRGCGHLAPCSPESRSGCHPRL